MFDYERYDHTYCRLSTDIEKAGGLKRRLSSASCEGLSDVDLNEHLSASRVTMERDNGVSQNREPVIIVRTKKARKTAPIIVKAMNKEGGAVLVSTVKTVSNSNSLVNKNKIVCPVVQQDEPEITGDNPEELTDEMIEEKTTDLKSDTATSNASDMPEDIPQTTKSGRTRKLTAKAKQISEDSKKTPKARKSPKVKTKVVDNNSKPKKGRGRPRKNLESNGEAVSRKIVLPELITKCGNDSEEDRSTANLNKDGSDKLQVTNNKKVTNAQRNKRKAPTSTDKPQAKLSRTPKNSIKSAQKISPASAKMKSKADSKPLVATKRSPKTVTRGKLVVVTKPPPKRRAQMRAQENVEGGKSRKSASQGIPAAKIDSSNIVRGSRRRR